MGDSHPKRGSALSEPLGLILADSQRALEEEIDAVQAELSRRGLRDPITGLHGRSRGEAGSGFRYAFQLPPGRCDIRAEDRVRILANGRETLGLVLEFDRRLGLLQLLSLEWLGESLHEAELEFDPTWLLRELSERLDDVARNPGAYHPDMTLGLFGRRPPRLGRDQAGLASSADLNPPQLEALERLLGSDVQLVWGPPGTGKSRLVARAALELGRRGRVLVTATTNGAVDEIAARLARLAPPETLRANRIIRVGSELGGGGAEELTLECAVRRRMEAGAGGVLNALDEIEALYSSPAGRNGDRPAPQARVARLLSASRARDDADTGRRLGRILVEVSRQSKAALEDAEIVLTTFARLAVREELRELRFDALIIDEASTAPLPYVALAAACAARTAVAVGDFQQLPPVVQSDGPAARRWLRRDLFRETGVVSEEGGRFSLPSPRDRLCAMLDLQYRMDPAIRGLVGEFFYDGRLRDAPDVTTRPGAATPILVLDTSRLSPGVERVDGSRRNAIHADVVSSFLEGAADVGESDIAVVSPYRAQTRFIRTLVRERLGRSAPRGLQVSTIHRFQGREKALVVIDTVDAPPGASWFLDERRNPDLPRLLNVALSRARDMLVLVASVDGLSRTLPEAALLRRILARAGELGTTCDAGELTRRPRPPSIHRFAPAERP